MSISPDTKTYRQFTSSDGQKVLLRGELDGDLKRRVLTLYHAEPPAGALVGNFIVLDKRKAAMLVKALLAFIADEVHS